MVELNLGNLLAHVKWTAKLTWSLACSHMVAEGCSKLVVGIQRSRCLLSHTRARIKLVRVELRGDLSRRLLLKPSLSWDDTSIRAIANLSKVVVLALAVVEC